MTKQTKTAQPPQKWQPTNKQKNTFINDGAYYCPRCQSDNIEPGAPVRAVKGVLHEGLPPDSRCEYLTARQAMLCPDCGLHWADIFRLRDIEIIGQIPVKTT